MLDLIARAALKPLREAADVLAGLTEGEIRSRAAIRLGADLVAGMALSDVVDYLIVEPDYDG